MPRGVRGLGPLQAVPDERFPLFATGAEFLRALDASLPGERFDATRGGGGGGGGGDGAVGDGGGSSLGSDRKGSRGDQERAALGALDDYFADDGDDGGDDSGGGGDGAFGFDDPSDGGAQAREVTYQVFAGKMWDKMKAKVSTSTGGSFEAALVWTEIKSYIKGSVAALKAHDEADDCGESAPERLKRLREAYLALGRKVLRPLSPLLSYRQSVCPLKY
jgi:hypothetical protein